MDERKDVRCPHEVGDEQHQEDNQDEAEHGPRETVPGRKLLEPGIELSDLLVRERRDTASRFLRADAQGTKLRPNVLPL